MIEIFCVFVGLIWLVREYTLICAVNRPIAVHVHIVDGDDGGGEEIDDADILPAKKPEDDEALRFN